MAVSFDCFAHIPFVGIEPADKLELHLGNLQRLPFEQWLALEDPSFEFEENRYSRAGPLFFHRRIELR